MTSTATQQARTRAAHALWPLVQGGAAPDTPSEGDEALVVLRDRRVYVGTVRTLSSDAVVLRLMGGPSLWFGRDELESLRPLGPRSSEQERLIEARQSCGLPALDLLEGPAGRTSLARAV